MEWVKNMKAIITGASSGIGKDMAKYLDSMGIETVLVARDENGLKKLQKELTNKSDIVAMDLAVKDNLYQLYDLYRNEDIDIFINNAGFGLFGDFIDTDLDRELDMINVNVVALHVLTKLFLKKFQKQGKGYILNTCSSAGFMAGPRLSTYYATKNYALKLTMAIYEELRRINSPVSISALCPGPVNTNFNKVAGGSFAMNGVSSWYVAKCGIDGMFKKKLFIIPTVGMKVGLFFTRFIGYKTLLKIVYHIQLLKHKD